MASDAEGATFDARKKNTHVYTKIFFRKINNLACTVRCAANSIANYSISTVIFSNGCTSNFR